MVDALPGCLETVASAPAAFVSWRATGPPSELREWRTQTMFPMVAAKSRWVGALAR